MAFSAAEIACLRQASVPSAILSAAAEGDEPKEPAKPPPTKLVEEPKARDDAPVAPPPAPHSPPRAAPRNTWEQLDGSPETIYARWIPL